MPVAELVTGTDLAGVALCRRGKVRDIYGLDGELLIVATDRISAFDCVLPDGVPHKGVVLTQMSRFWFERLRHVVPNHLITADVERYPEPLRAHARLLEGRSMLVRRAERLPVECVVRGYLAGSGWKEYRRAGSVCGVGLPEGLPLAARLPEPVFTPARKAEEGHDENISYPELEAMVGRAVAERLRSVSLRLYREAAAYAEGRGILVADTKFEFGLVGGELLLIDELLTPDSSRFWAAEGYRPGSSPPCFDKQYVRDYLSGLGWDGAPPPPSLPAEVVAETSRRYLEAYRRITGEPLPVPEQERP